MFHSLTEAQLRRHMDNKLGIFIAESPKVINVALNAGYEPVAMLCEDRHITGDAADIIAHYPIVIYPRHGSTVDSSTLPPTVRLVDTPLYNISSTEVREDVRAGRDISAKVPSSIVDDVMRFYK